ncbi:MAG: beta-ketoacyl-[acyl-carrier-protein] synthase II [Candidatus Omnitrophica bacterium]|nr:beta-ketoacyl-[acyl-carrier-protein] synthase II [Candidatus Omnitrophota bacterium]
MVNPNGHRRVVVTGMGIVSPLGLSREENWANLIRGKSGIGKITLFDASEFPVQIAGEVRDFDFDFWVTQDEDLKKAGRSSFFALQAAQEAIEDARLRKESEDPERLGLYFAAGDWGINFDGFVATLSSSWGGNGKIVDPGKYISRSSDFLEGRGELEIQPFMTVKHLAKRFGIEGTVSNCLTACAASSQAIGEAFEEIRRGDADLVLTGGSHSMIYPLGVAGFSSLTVLSKRNNEPEKASRPFDKKRDGFVLSEGAAALVLEELSHALKRGAPIYGEVIGYGSTADAYRLTDMDPEGEGACRAIELALRKARINPDEVDYINAHGTATLVNDAIETLVIKKVFGEAAYKIPVSSIKSMLGHMIAAAGASELIACLLAIRDGVIPPTINYEESDSACDLDYVPNESREANVDVALSNSFGFGGQNICLIAKRYE